MSLTFDILLSEFSNCFAFAVVVAVVVVFVVVGFVLPEHLKRC